MYRWYGHSIAIFQMKICPIVVKMIITMLVYSRKNSLKNADAAIKARAYWGWQVLFQLNCRSRQKLIGVFYKDCSKALRVSARAVEAHSYEPKKSFPLVSHLFRQGFWPMRFNLLAQTYTYDPSVGRWGEMAGTIPCWCCNRVYTFTSFIWSSPQTSCSWTRLS